MRLFLPAAALPRVPASSRSTVAAVLAKPGRRGLLSIKQFDGVFGMDGKMTVDSNREVKVKGLILRIGPGGRIEQWHEP